MWHDIEQNTDEWLDLRAGKVTGSAIAKVMANYGKAFGKPAKDYAVNIAIEQLTGITQLSGYSNGHMERGHEEEPIARALYEDRHFVDVCNGGFFDNLLTGSSPDGLVCDDGLIEIKSAIPSIHYDRIRKGGVDPTYKWQHVFTLRETERDWIDFVSYCSSFPIKTRLYVYRMNKADVAEELKMIDVRLQEFFDEVDKVKAAIG